MGGNPRGFATLFCLFPNIVLSDLLLTVFWFMIYYTTGGKSAAKKKVGRHTIYLDIVSFMGLHGVSLAKHSVWFRVDHVRIPW